MAGRNWLRTLTNVPVSPHTALRGQTRLGQSTQHVMMGMSDGGGVDS